MRRALGFAAVLGVVVWSAVAWGGSALLSAADGVFGTGSALAASYPDVMAWLAPAVSLFAGAGSAGVMIIWLAGLAAIALLYLIARFALGGLPAAFDRYGERRHDRRTYDRRDRSYEEDDDEDRWRERPGKRRRARRDWDDDDDDD